MIKWIKDKIIWFFFGSLVFAGAIVLLNTPPLGGDIETPTLSITETIESIGIEEVLKEKTVIEKSDIKSEELSKITVDKYTSGDFTIEIVGDITEIDGGIQLFARAWKDGKPVGFGKDGTVEIERFRIYNPPVLVDDENGDIIREWTDEFTKETKQRKLKYDPLQAIKNDLAHTISLVGKSGTKIIKGSIGNTTSTFRPDAGTGNTTVDGITRQGYAAGSGVAWATIRAAAGSLGRDTEAIDTVCSLWSDPSSVDHFYEMDRSIFTLNTAVIDADEISSAIFSVYGYGEGDALTGASVNIYASDPANSNAVVAGDYVYTKFGTTAFSTSKDITDDTVTGAYNNFTFNQDGIDYINKTGITELGGREATYDAPNSTPTDNDGGAYFQVYHADQTGTDNDPKLVVEHSLAVSRRIILIE